MLDFATSADPRELILMVLLFAAGVLAVQGGLGVVRMATTRQTINRRLQVKSRAGTVEDLIVELRKERGLDQDGDFALFSTWFNRLVTRSGLKYEPLQWAAVSAVASAVLVTPLIWFMGAWLYAFVGFVILFFVLPVFVLNWLGNGRSKKLAEQLPDALAIVVRSLEAGHPVPTAIALVGREMPDPIGSEFGMVADEMSYGSSLSDAVLRLGGRVEDPDIDLFAATIRLQERTGGNLAELLKLIGSAVRDRQMLRLKVKAASSEGRASAMILTAAPFIVATLIYWMRPEFYGEVIDVPMVKYGIAGFIVWMMIGNIIMQRMIKFKI